MKTAVLILTGIAVIAFGSGVTCLFFSRSLVRRKKHPLLVMLLSVFGLILVIGSISLFIVGFISLIVSLPAIIFTVIIISRAVDILLIKNDRQKDNT